MVRRFTTLRARMLAMLAACVWAWTGIASELHELVVVHAVCAEHNEVVEVGPRSPDPSSASRPADRLSAHPSSQGDQVRTGTAPQHDHGCQVHPVFRPVATAAPRAVQRGTRIRLVEPIAAHAAAPLAAPLDYAPKTSPPSVG